MSLLDLYGPSIADYHRRTSEIAFRSPADLSEVLGRGWDYAKQTFWIGQLESVRENVFAEDLALYEQLTGQAIDLDEARFPYQISPRSLAAWDTQTAFFRERISELPPEQREQFNLNYDERVRGVFEESRLNFEDAMGAASGFERFLGQASVFAGGMADPTLLAVSVLGGAAMIPRGLTLARATGLETAFGAAIEAAATPAISRQVQAAGQDYGFGEAVLNIALGGLFSGTVYAGIRGIGRATGIEQAFRNREFAGLITRALDRTSIDLGTPFNDVGFALNNAARIIDDATATPVQFGGRLEAVETLTLFDRATEALITGRTLADPQFDVSTIDFPFFLRNIELGGERLANALDDFELGDAVRQGTAAQVQALRSEFDALESSIVSAAADLSTADVIRLADVSAKGLDNLLNEFSLENVISRFRSGEATPSDLARFVGDPLAQERFLELGEALRTRPTPEVQAEANRLIRAFAPQINRRLAVHQDNLRNLAQTTDNERAELFAMLRQDPEYIADRVAREQAAIREVSAKQEALNRGESLGEVSAPVEVTPYQGLVRQARQVQEEAAAPERVEAANVTREEFVRTGIEDGTIALSRNQAEAVAVIRAAAGENQIVSLTYNGKARDVEPYSFRYSKDGNVSLFAHDIRDGKSKSFRLDKIEGAVAKAGTFEPRFDVEITPSGPIEALQRAAAEAPGRKFAISLGNEARDLTPDEVLRQLDDDRDFIAAFRECRGITNG